MKNIKQILLVAAALLYTVNVSAEEKEVTFFETKNQSTNAVGPGTGGGGTEGSDPDPAAPIDDYLPLLVIGAGLVALRFRKQLLKN